MTTGPHLNHLPSSINGNGGNTDVTNYIFDTVKTMVKVKNRINGKDIDFINTNRLIRYFISYINT